MSKITITISDDSAVKLDAICAESGYSRSEQIEGMLLAEHREHAPHYSTDADSADYPYLLQTQEGVMGLWIPAEEESTLATGFVRGHRVYATQEAAEARRDKLLSTGKWSRGLRVTCQPKSP